MIPDPDLRFVGPPRFRDSHGEWRAIPDLSAALLVYLWLERHAHARDSLASLLWPGLEPRAARANLRTRLHRIRSFAGDRLIEASATHVTLMPESRKDSDLDWVDRVGAKIDAEHPGDDPLCETCSREAAELIDSVGGALLEGMRRSPSAEFDDWLAGAAARVELALERIRRRVRVESLGRREDEPSDELPRRTAGREPGAAVLPLSADRFVGRDDEGRRVATALRRSPLVTLWGPGGVGKTRLAVETARATAGQYNDGVFFVDLSVCAGEERVLAAIADSVGVRPMGTRPIAAALKTALDGREVLLVLDNCEHVVSGAARAADWLTAHCSGAHVLATSRQPLGLPCETVLPVAPLDRPAETAAVDVDALFDSPAVELFVDRARLADPSFSLTESNALDVARILDLVDGLPLAIELVAGKVRALAPSDIRRLLDGGGADGIVLRGGALARHRSIEATVDWSVDLLSPVARSVFPRLAVFRGSFSLDSGVRVCGESGPDSAAVLVDSIAELVEKSLLRVVDAPDRATAGRRYAFSRIVGERALRLLRQHGDERAARDAHLSWAAAVVAEADRHHRDPDVGHAWEILRAEAHQIEAALEWARGSGWRETGLRMTNALSHYWRAIEQVRHGFEWQRAFLEMGGDVPDAVFAVSLWVHALQSYNQSRLAEGESLVDRALSLFSRLPLCPEYALALHTKLMYLGRSASGCRLDLGVTALRIAHRLRLPWLIGELRVAVAEALLAGGASENAVFFQLERAVGAADRYRTGTSACSIYLWAGDLYGRLGHHGDAERCIVASRGALPEWMISARRRATGVLTDYAKRTGQFVRANRLIRGMVDVAQRAGDLHVVVWSVLRLVDLCVTASVPRLAARFWGLYLGTDDDVRPLEPCAAFVRFPHWRPVFESPSAEVAEAIDRGHSYHLRDLPRLIDEAEEALSKSANPSG